MKWWCYFGTTWPFDVWNYHTKFQARSICRSWDLSGEGAGCTPPSALGSMWNAVIPKRVEIMLITLMWLVEKIARQTWNWRVFFKKKNSFDAWNWDEHKKCKKYKSDASNKYFHKKNERTNFNGMGWNHRLHLSFLPKWCLEDGANKLIVAFQSFVVFSPLNFKTFADVPITFTWIGLSLEPPFLRRLL